MSSAVLKALATVVIWGVSFIAIRVALEAAEPLGVVWIRNASGALLLFLLLRARGQPWLPERGDRARCVLLGLIAGSHLLIQTIALRMTTAMRAGWIVAFIPIVIAVGARLFLKQRMRAIGWLGIATATAGVLVLTSTRPAQLARAGLGDALMLGSTFTWGAYSLLSLGPARRNGGLRVTATALAVSVVPTLGAALFTGTWHSAPTPRALAALAFLALCASALAMWMFAEALAELGPERTAAFQYLQPFVTVVASFLILSEPFTAAQFLGGPLVLLGVWLVQLGKRAAAA